MMSLAKLMVAVAKGETEIKEEEVKSVEETKDETLKHLKSEKANLIKKFRVADGPQRLELKKAIEEINKEIRVKMA